MQRSSRVETTCTVPPRPPLAHLPKPIAPGKAGTLHADVGENDARAAAETVKRVEDANFILVMKLIQALR